MEIPKIPYPIKNWENLNEYPHPKETSREQWAWEFLRRNPNYQEDYFEYKNSPPDLLTEYEYPDQDNPKVTKKVKLGIYIKNRYGICGGILIDPSNDNPEKIFPQFQNTEMLHFPEKFWEYSEGEYTWKPKHPFQVAIVFDLSFPLPKQIAKAKNILKYKKSFFKDRLPASKSRPEKYVEYLRLLDAKYSKTSAKEMEKICPSKKYSEADNLKQWVSDSLNRAEELIDSYLFLS